MRLKELINFIIMKIINRTAPDVLKKIVYVMVSPFVILMTLLLFDYFFFGTSIFMSKENNFSLYFGYSMIIGFLGVVLRAFIRFYEDTADGFDVCIIAILLITLAFINSEWDNLGFW